jgi:hypothetical protein
MGKGTPKIVFRLDVETAELMRQTLERRNMWTRDEEWTVSDFIRVAVREKCAKMRRCRACRRRRTRTDELAKVLSL